MSHCQVRPALLLPLLAVGLSAACDSSVGPVDTSPLTVGAYSATSLTGRIGMAVMDPPSIYVRRGEVGAGGVEVNFRILSGGGRVERPVDHTGIGGFSTAGAWTLGTVVGEQRLGVFIGDSLYLTFVASALPRPDFPPIVYSAAGSDGRQHIFRVGSLGAPRVALTAGSSGDLFPTVSPDGNRIAFLRDGRLHLMNSDGANVIAVSQPSDAKPHGRLSWSRDGSAFAFSDQSTSGLSVVNVDGSGYRRLTMPNLAPVICATCTEYVDHTPDWSPDGARIVFTRWVDLEFSVIWTINADGSGATQVGRQEVFGNGVRTWASWSPIWNDDGRIAFAGPDNSYQGSVFAMEANNPFSVKAIATTPWQNYCGPTDWSTDGDWLLLDCSSAQSNVHLVDVRTGMTTLLFSGASASFLQPSGRAARERAGMTVAGGGRRTAVP